MSEKKQKFEDALARLERIVAEMEGGDLPLDDMLKKFEEGRSLVQSCTAELESIRQRIEKVTSTQPPQVAPLDIMKST
ncbi:MAG: exodeoxyribonuclease VII small subunit [Kiritimatiellae bacterium]|nr:exodeoxyribonuclease VII small subunit [Kiritimatiellia bacterium]